MSHYAFYAEVESIRAIPKADRIQVATIMGYDVVTSKSTKPGDRGILIIEGAQVDQDFALTHDLLRKHPETGEKLGGYLEDNRRVRAIRMRGQNSEGIFVTAEVEDDQLGDAVEGVAVKYQTPAQLRARSQSEAKIKKPQAFPVHYDTAKLRHAALDLLRPGLARVAITEKLHGTSGRTASVREESLTALARAWNFLVFCLVWLVSFGKDDHETREANSILSIAPSVTHTLISGTRRVILDPDGPGEKGMAYRQDVHNALASIIHDGERWYYEIVGYGDNGVPIMPPHDGEHYSYGCERGGEGLGDRFKIYVYRVVDPNGNELGISKIEDLIETRADNAQWINTPPVLGYIEAADLGDDPRGKLMSAAKSHADGWQSSLGPSHIREGVCLRSENADGYCVSPAVKYKSFVFCMREGIRANDDGFVDPEDVA
jgi:hypothetical protein